MAGLAANFSRSDASGMADRATSALIFTSQAARCSMARLAPSAALARASAALAGGWKPAPALSSVRRAESRRETASCSDTACNCWQVRKA
ncbi:hypothetical protein D3C85_699250 [compost metagenome]